MGSTRRTPEPIETTADQIDRELARAAIAKRQQGVLPSMRELAGLTRYERLVEERKRWQFYRTIPQKHWRSMSGRQARTINEQAVAYGIPFGGREVNLPDVVRAMHDFFARHAHRLASILGDDPLLADSGEPTMFLEKLREETWKLRRLERLERETQLVSRDVVHEALARIAGIIRQAGDTLQRQFGSEAFDVLNDALDDAEREIEASFGRVEHSDKTNDST